MIAFDASSTGEVTSGTTLTVSHTCTGSARILFVSILCGTTATAATTGVTYNGVAMTKVAEDLAQTNAAQSLWYLIAPATGAHNIVATANSTITGRFTLVAYSYTGVKQISPIDSSNHNNSTAEAGTSFTRSTTVVGANCWLVMGASAVSSDPDPGAGTTERLEAVTNKTPALFDSNGVVGTGSQSLIYTALTADNHGWEIVSILPALVFTVAETQGSTDTVTVTRVVNLSDTQGSTDTTKLTRVPKNTSKSTSTWSNTNKS